MKSIIMLLACSSLLSVTGCGTVHAILHTPVFHAPASTTTPPPKETISTTVTKEVHFMWLLAVLMAIAAVVCAYPLQNYFLAICLGAGALVLPIVATIWSLYYGWILAALCIGGAVFAYVHYRVVLTPWINSIVADVKAEAAKLTSSKPAAPAVAPAAPTATAPPAAS